MPADGRLLSIAQNSALFAILETRYGGNGTTNFALPDLRGRTAIGTGTGAGLSTRTLGESIGTETVTLTEVQLPSHTHTIPSELTGATGSNQPVNNVQPSLALTYAIATEGIFPSQPGSGASSCDRIVCIGQVGLFAFNEGFLDRNVPGWLPADGRLLSIADNEALFTLLGTTYGGDGTTNFALPDLRGRTLIGTGFNGGSVYDLGETDGSESNVLSLSQLASHNHAFVATAVPEPSGIFGTLLFGTLAGRVLLARRRQLATANK